MSFVGLVAKWNRILVGIRAINGAVILPPGELHVGRNLQCTQQSLILRRRERVWADLAELTVKEERIHRLEPSS